MNVDDQPPGMDNSLQPLVILCLCVAGIWAFAGVVVYVTFGNWQERGAFGDMFGAVNALFSSLAFAGIVHAILLQRRELALNLLEFRRAADAQEKARMATLLMEVYEFMYVLRPKWLRLYRLSAQEANWLEWTQEDRQVGEEVAAQLQRVAYLCEKGLLDPTLVRDNWGVVFVKCWDILQGQIEDYRHEWERFKEPYGPRPPRADFQALATRFRAHYESVRQVS